MLLGWNATTKSSPSRLIIVFRHANAGELRKMRGRLRWEVVSDTVAEPDDLASR